MAATLTQNRFWLQKVADGSRGERFIIQLEADAGREADCENCFAQAGYV